MKNMFSLVLLLLLVSSTPLFAQIGSIYNLYNCNMESNCPILQFNTLPQNIWQVGKPVKPFFSSAYSAPNAIVTDTINAYPPSNDAYFDIKLPMGMYDAHDWGNRILFFKHQYQTDSLKDGGYIEASYDGGATWVNVINDTMPMYMTFANIYSAQDSLQGGKKGFSGTTNDWIQTKIQWVWSIPITSPKITTFSDTFLIRFHFVSDSIQTNKDGWLIDNIVIGMEYMGNSITHFQNEDANYLKINPNPIENKSIISFHNPQIEPLEILVFNHLGQVVKDIKPIYESQVELSAEDLPIGFYYIQLKEVNKILKTAKFVRE